MLLGRMINACKLRWESTVVSNSRAPQGSVHMSMLLNIFIGKGVEQKYLMAFVNCQGFKGCVAYEELQKDLDLLLGDLNGR